MRTGLLTVLALVGFAANSLLCRAALAGGALLAGVLLALSAKAAPRVPVAAPASE